MSNDISEFSRTFWEAKYSAWRKEHPDEFVVPEMTMRLWQRELERKVREMKKQKGGGENDGL